MTRTEAQLLKSGAGYLACAFFFILSIAIAALLATALGTASDIAVADDGTDGQESEATLTAYELQLQIEEAQESYAAIQEEVERINEEIDANRERIADLEKQIPAQQERSAKAARELYKIQEGGLRITDLLLSSDNLGDFLAGYEYINYVTDAHLSEMTRLANLKAEIDAAERDLEATQSEASARMNDARATIDELEAAQAEVQRRIEEEARQQAELAAALAAKTENPRDNDQQDADPETQDQGSGEQGAAEATGTAPTPVAASSDEAAFIAEWAPRIDAYLAGSPLAGQGTTFARAAYKYNVDPRWSPAISFTESGKGAVCFLPHNAWGWGSISWSSWEEAIDAHVRGLANGYGYTISEEAAKKYCPPNWQHWYNRTSEQMNLI